MLKVGGALRASRSSTARPTIISNLDTPIWNRLAMPRLALFSVARSYNVNQAMISWLATL